MAQPKSAGLGGGESEGSKYLSPRWGRGDKTIDPVIIGGRGPSDSGPHFRRPEWVSIPSLLPGHFFHLDKKVSPSASIIEQLSLVVNLLLRVDDRGPRGQKSVAIIPAVDVIICRQAMPLVEHGGVRASRSDLSLLAPSVGRYVAYTR